jgi:hypothetical protein
MAIVEIPTDASTPQYEQVTSLDGKAYVLELSWSDRSESWYLSVSLQRDNQIADPIVLGMRLSIGYPVLAGVTADGRPPGEIFAVDVSGGYGSDPTRYDLGTRVRLVYYDAAEMGRALT